MDIQILRFFYIILSTHAMLKASLFIAARTLISHTKYDQDLGLCGSFHIYATIWRCNYSTLKKVKTQDIN